MTSSHEVAEPLRYKVPRPEASPSEVRAYLVHILINSHDTTPVFAQETADRWKLGRGWDLRELSAQGYRRILGDDVGPYLIRTVKRDLADEEAAANKLEWDQWWRSPYPQRHYYVAIVSIFVAAAILYLYGRAVTAVYVALTLQVPLVFKMPIPTVIALISLYIGFSVFPVSLIVGGY